MGVTRYVVFHDGSSATGTGVILPVEEYRSLTIEIWGDSASRTIDFKGIGLSGSPASLTGVRTSDFSTGTSTNGSGEIWQFDVTGLEKVYFNLSAVSGGKVYIKGKIVN